MLHGVSFYALPQKMSSLRFVRFEQRTDRVLGRAEAGGPRKYDVPEAGFFHHLYLVPDRDRPA